MMLLLQGDRGLFASDGKRIYFPDRSWKDAKPCIIESYDILRDKDTYAFIKGNPVVAEDISLLDIPNFSDYNIYKQVIIGDTKLILQKVQSKTINVYFKENGSTQILEVYMNEAITKLWHDADRVDLLDLAKYTEFLDTEEKMEEAVVRLVGALQSSNIADNISQIGVLDNSLIYIKEYFIYSDATYENVYLLKGDNFIRVGSYSDLKGNTKIIKKYSLSELADICIKYGIIANKFADNVEFSDKIQRFTLVHDSVNIVIYGFCAKNFSLEYYHSDESAIERELIKQSMDEYNRYIKSIGKTLTAKSAVNVLSELSLKKNILKLKAF